MDKNGGTLVLQGDESWYGAGHIRMLQDADYMYNSPIAPIFVR